MYQNGQEQPRIPAASGLHNFGQELLTILKNKNNKTLHCLFALDDPSPQWLGLQGVPYTRHGLSSCPYSAQHNDMHCVRPLSPSEKVQHLWQDKPGLCRQESFLHTTRNVPL